MKMVTCGGLLMFHCASREIFFLIFRQNALIICAQYSKHQNIYGDLQFAKKLSFEFVNWTSEDSKTWNHEMWMG